MAKALITLLVLAFVSLVALLANAEAIRDVNSNHGYNYQNPIHDEIISSTLSLRRKPRKILHTGCPGCKFHTISKTTFFLSRNRGSEAGIETKGHDSEEGTNTRTKLGSEPKGAEEGINSETVMVSEPVSPDMVGYKKGSVLLSEPASPDMERYKKGAVLLSEPASPDMEGYKKGAVLLSEPASPDMEGYKKGAAVLLSEPVSPDMEGYKKGAVLLSEPVSPDTDEIELQH